MQHHKASENTTTDEWMVLP